MKELRELAELEAPPSVGIITPHTEQQALLVQLVNRQDDAERLNEALDLKIMTFDTCQGEERDVILYSMVATRISDKLAYVFPKSLDDAEEVDHVLRLQRLNVGFSRAKEKIDFYLSKPIEEFSGAIGKALQHFKSVLENGRTAPGPADTRSEVAHGKESAGVAEPDAARATVRKLCRDRCAVPDRGISATGGSDVSASEL